jgi:hypothetical protein
MRGFYVALLTFCLITGPALAQKISDHAQSAEPRTRIETDDKVGIIRFIVDGKEIARVTAAGLQVREDIAYGGSLMDYGQQGYDAQSRQETKKP